MKIFFLKLEKPSNLSIIMIKRIILGKNWIIYFYHYDGFSLLTATRVLLGQHMFLSPLWEMFGKKKHVLNYFTLAERSSGKMRSEIFPTFQCTVMIKLILAVWQHMTPLFLVLKNCVIQSFTTMCHNLLVKVDKVVWINKYCPKRPKTWINWLQWIWQPDSQP